MPHSRVWSCAKVSRRQLQKFLLQQEALKLVYLLEEYGDRPSVEAIHLLLLTGASKSEILYARWQDVHLRRAVLATRMTYTGQSRFIPLNTEAIRLIRRLPRRKDGAVALCFFIRAAPYFYFYTWNLLRTRLGRPELRIQDLRHNFAGLTMF